MHMDKKLKIEKDQLLGRMKEILDATTGDLTEAQRRDYDKLDAQASKLSAEIAAIEARRAEARATGNFVSIPESGELPRTARPPRAGIGLRYGDLFADQLSTGGFADFEEFANTFRSGLADPRLSAQMNQGTLSEGGALVPSQFAAQLLDHALEDEVVRPRAVIHKMETKDLHIAAFSYGDMTDDAPAGIKARWLAEGATATEDKGETRKVQLLAKRLAAYTSATMELVDDGMDFANQLAQAMSKSISWAMDLAFIRGTGAGQPLGLLNSASVVTITKQSGQAANTIVLENLTKAFSRLHPASVRNAIWVAHPSTLPQLLSLAFVIKNVAGSENVGGSQWPVLSESNGELRLLSRPLILSEKASALGTTGDILLADFSQYHIGLRAEVFLQRSDAPGWKEGVASYRMVVRVDGQPGWDAAYTPRSGDTLAWATKVETRA